MLLVRIAVALAAAAAGLAALLGSTADKLPDTDAACVTVPVPNVQAGYCPAG